MKHPSSRLMFRLVLEEYNFDIEYVKVLDNQSELGLMNVGTRICERIRYFLQIDKKTEICIIK